MREKKPELATKAPRSVTIEGWRSHDVRTGMIRSSSVIALLVMLVSSGCRSVVAPRTPQIKTIASIGDRPQSATAGEPGDSQSTEPEAKPRVADDDREIRGRVVDDRGNPVANAKVRVALDGSGAGRVVKTSTDETGRFTLHELRPDSDYTLIAEDDDGNIRGRTRAATADRRVQITFKGLAKVQRASNSAEETTPIEEPPASRIDGVPNPPTAPRESASIPENRKDRAASRVSTGKTVAWKGASSGKESEPEVDPPASKPLADDPTEPGAKQEEPRDLPIPRPSDPDRDDLPSPKPSRTVKVEPAAPIEMPKARPEPAPEPEPPPISAIPAAEPRSESTPKPIEGPPPARTEPEPEPIIAAPAPTPRIEAPPASVEPAPMPIAEPPASKPEEPKSEANPAPNPEPVVEAPPASNANPNSNPEPVVEAPPASNPEPKSNPEPEAPAATQVSGLKRPTWGELSSRKSPRQIAMNSPAASGRRRYLGQNKGVDSLGKSAENSDAVEPTCQYDPKAQRLVNFRLPDLSGNPVELRDFDSDLVLIDFWGTWCGPCLESIPHLVQLQEQYGKRLRIIGIAYEQGSTAEQAKAVEAIAKQLGINYTVLLGGADGKPCPIQAALHVQAYPTMVLVDRQGRQLWKDSGASARTLSRLDYKLSSMVGSNVVRR